MEGQKRGRETSTCACLSLAPYWGPGPHPRHVPWLGMELAMLWFTGQHSIQWATPARVRFWLLYPFDMPLHCLSILLLFGTTRCHTLILYFPSPNPEVNHFSREPQNQYILSTYYRMISLVFTATLWNKLIKFSCSHFIIQHSEAWMGWVN